MSKRHHHHSSRRDKKESHNVCEIHHDTKEKTKRHRERGEKKESRRKLGGERNTCKKHQICSTNNQECGIVRYPKMGACCIDGLCSIQEEQECLRAGGFWIGTDTRCWEVTCPDAPLGACVVPGGQCGLTRECDCPGMWMGPYTSCQNYIPYGGTYQPWTSPCLPGVGNWGEGGWRQINGAPPWIARNVGSNALYGTRRPW